MDRIYVSEAAFQEAVSEAAGLPITPRDLFAAAALSGLAAGKPEGLFAASDRDHGAHLCFAMADAMMAARTRR